MTFPVGPGWCICTGLTQDLRRAAPAEEKPPRRAAPAEEEPPRRAAPAEEEPPRRAAPAESSSRGGGAPAESSPHGEQPLRAEASTPGGHSVSSAPQDRAN